MCCPLVAAGKPDKRPFFHTWFYTRQLENHCNCHPPQQIPRMESDFLFVVFGLVLDQNVFSGPGSEFSSCDYLCPCSWSSRLLNHRIFIADSYTCFTTDPAATTSLFCVFSNNRINHTNKQYVASSRCSAALLQVHFFLQLQAMSERFSWVCFPGTLRYNSSSSSWCILKPVDINVPPRYQQPYLAELCNDGRLIGA